MNNPNTPLKDLEALQYIEGKLKFPEEVLLSFPKYFLIETTNLCNARCVMCGIDFDSKKKGVMSDELYEKITSEIGKHKDHVEKVMLYLDCEPLLDKKLSMRIKNMKEAGVKKVNIASNASLLDRERASQLIEAGLDEIYVTIDSLKKDVFEAIRPGLNFDTVYKNFTEFINIRNKLNPKLIIRVQMIMQESNKNEAELFTKHWERLLDDNDQIIVQRAHNWGSTVETMEFGDENIINNVPCIALWGTLCIHVDGEVGLCCMDTNTTIPVGNTRSQTISEIWSGKPLNDIRTKHIEGQRCKIPICDGCTVWRESKHDSEQILGIG